MVSVRKFDQAEVIRFLTDNPTLSHAKAAKALCDAGINICHTTIGKIRREEKIEYGRPENAKDFAERMHKNGVEITHELLKSAYPNMTKCYANVLVSTYSPVERVLKKTQPIEPEVPKLPPGQRQLPSGIITRTGNRTIHRMF